MNKLKDSVFIIDVSTLLYKSYYGRNNNNILERFFKWLFHIISEYKPDKLCMVFDERDRSKLYRRKLLSTYKADRKPKPQAIIEAEDILIEFCNNNNINWIRLDGQESDDCISSVCKLFSKTITKCVVVTLDGDLCSLFKKNNVYIAKLYSDSIKVCDTWNKVKKEFGKVKSDSPECLRESLALIGDPSDGIKGGVKGYGVVKANKLISECGGLKQLFENLEEFVPEKDVQKFLDSREQLFLNRKLIKLYDKLPVGSIKDYTYTIDYDYTLDFLEKHNIHQRLYNDMYNSSDLILDF